MKIKLYFILMCGLICYSAGYASSSKLKIYLPREVVVENETVFLHDISILRGEKSLINEARDLILGKFSFVGQKIVLTRHTLLSRLASNGIREEYILIHGADEVTVKRDERTIKGPQFVKLAENYIKQQKIVQSGGNLTLIRDPEDMALPTGAETIDYNIQFNPYNSHGKIRMIISVLADGREVGTQELLFKTTYQHRRAVAAYDIPAGAVLSAGNIVIEEVDSPNPEPVGWQPPYGLVARKAIKAGRVITDMVAEQAKPPVVIKRRQSVMMKYETAGLSVSSLCMAMEEGRVGELIRLKSDSGKGRIVVGKVKQNGTVEPVF